MFGSTNQRMAYGVLRNIQHYHHSGILYDTSKTSMEVLNAGYPRGRKEITSLLTKYFPPMQQQRWFEDRGITLTTKQDGAMIVSYDNDNDHVPSEIIKGAIIQDGFNDLIETKSKVCSISKDAETERFHVSVNGKTEFFDCVILATGNSHIGHQLARSLGHTTIKPARSCFGIVLNDTAILSSLEEGNTYHLPHVRLSYKVHIKGQKRPRTIKSEGSAQLHLSNDGVITLTGMATLSLTSSAAMELKDANYKGTLLVHFSPDFLGGKVENIEQFLWQFRLGNPDSIVGNQCPVMHQYVDYDEYDWETESFKTTTMECIPTHLWEGMVLECSLPNGSTWSKISPKKCRKLAEMIVGCPFEICARDTGSAYPFINSGGVNLREIDMSSMESKVVTGLFCCGQLLDGDGSHNCFSLMRSFATGKLAGEKAVAYAIEQSLSKIKMS